MDLFLVIPMTTCEEKHTWRMERQMLNITETQTEVENIVELYDTKDMMYQSDVYSNCLTSYLLKVC